MRLLLFNFATDSNHPAWGFATRWIEGLARRLEFVYVISLQVGTARLPGNVRVYSLGKEKGSSRSRRVASFYVSLWRVLLDDAIDVCFCHMNALFGILGAPLLKAYRIPIVTWYAHPSLNQTLKTAHWLSDRMVSSLSTAYPYRQDKLEVVGQGIDTASFAPNGRENAIGSLLYHIALVEMSWLFFDVMLQDFPPTIKNDFPLDMADAERRLTRVLGVPLAEHLGRLERSRAVFLDTFCNMTLDDWRRLRSPGDVQDQVTPEWAVFHLVEHEAGHAYQISSLKARAARTGVSRGASV